MPPPNTPNEPSGASSPTSIRPSRTHAEPSRASARVAASDSFVRDLETIFASPFSPTGSASGSATPSVSTTPTGADEQEFPGLRPVHPHERSSPRRTATFRRTSNTTGPGWTPTHLPLQTPELSPESQDPTVVAVPESTSSPFEPQIDWQGLEYAAQVDENLLCGICKTPFYKPLTTKACGHTFCEACLNQALEETRGRSRNRAPCPLCRTELNIGGERGARRFIRVVEMSAQLDRLEVQCPNDAQLCKWVGPRSNVETHVRSDCPYTLCPCADDSCRKTIIRKSRGTDCRHQEGPCAYCAETIDLSTEDQHCLTVCAKYRAPCEYCGGEIARHLLAAHAEICKVEPATCSYAKLGCSYTSSRQDVIEHDKKCNRGAVMNILNGLEKRFTANIIQVKESMMNHLDQRIQRERLHMEVRIQELQEEYHEERRKREELLKNLVRSGAGDSRPLRYRDPLAGSTTSDEEMSERARSWLSIPAGSDFEQAEYMFRMFDELDTRISNISKALIDQDARHSVMLLNELMPIKEQLVEARSQLGVIGMHVRWLMDLQRSRQRQATDVVGGLGAAAGSPGTPVTDSDAQAGQAGQAAAAASAGGSGPADSRPGVSRRVSERVSPVRPSL